MFVLAMDIPACFFVDIMINLLKMWMCLIIFSLSYNIIGIVGTFLTCFYVFEKATKYASPLHLKIYTAFWCMFWAVLSIVVSAWLPLLLVRSLFCTVSVAYIFLSTKLRLDTVVSAFLLSFGISYSLYFIVATPATIIFGVFVLENINEYTVGTTRPDLNQPIYLPLFIITAVAQFFLATRIFRIRRFRNGFPFLFKRYAVVLALITAGIIMIFVMRMHIIGASEEVYTVFLLMAGILIMGVGIYIWIRRGIKMFLRKRIRERNEELLQQEITRLERELEQSEKNNEILRAANHSINHRLTAMQRIIESILQKGKKSNISTEFATEIAAAMTDIRKMADEYSNDVARVKTRKKIPSTNIRMIDEIFRLFSDKLDAINAAFMLHVSGSIVYMVENIISQSRLEILIGDHLQNALIAVNASNRTNGSVIAMIGEAGDYYAFTVYDSGIPFEVDTLVRLGTKRVTTHSETGGSGVGFMKTFETMKECNASLIIKENKPGGIFTKSITVLFDGEGRFIIETYRADDFPKNERYTIKSC